MTQNPVIFIIDPSETERAETAELVSEFDVEYETYRTADEFLARFSPDRSGCVFAELQLGRLSALRLPQELRTRGSELPVLLLTSRATVAVAVEGFKAGLFDLLEKPTNTFDLWDRATRAFDQHEQRQNAAWESRQLQRQLASLTEEERSVMQMMLDGEPNKIIASRLSLSSRTIVFRRQSLMRKLHVSSLAELACLTQTAARGDWPAFSASPSTPWQALFPIPPVDSPSVSVGQSER